MSHQPDIPVRPLRKRSSHQNQQPTPPIKQPKLKEPLETLEGEDRGSTSSRRKRSSKASVASGLSIAKPTSSSSAVGRQIRSSFRRRRSGEAASSAAVATRSASATEPPEEEANNNLKGRISNLCDYFPEVNVPNFKRITRSFTRRLSSSRESADAPGEENPDGRPESTPFNLGSSGSSFGSVPSDLGVGKKLTHSTQDISTSNTGACGSITCSAASVLPPMRGTGRNSVAPAKSNSTSGIPTQASPMDSSMDSTGATLDANTAARDTLEVGRLQALLEASGLSGHFFSALAPRMHGILHRGSAPSGAGAPGGGAGSTHTKVQSLLAGMQQVGDESAQLQSVMEMCQLLLLGNEDTLGSSFPMKQLVQVLMQLLTLEENFDIMTHACRALTYAMEALPRSTTVVCDALPLLLAKLQHIECMDVAEQALTTVEMLSRRHSKAILCAGGISACLAYVDFFSLPAQRNALVTTANCCYHMISDEFKFVANSLPALTQRLTIQDKKSVESVCLCFTRLTDSFHADPVKLETIASSDFLKSILQLLVVSPPILSTQTFINVNRMLYQMCAANSLLAVKLIKHNIGDTLRFLLVGSPREADAPATDIIELVARSPQELHEMVCLIGELLPKLPTDGIFWVDGLLQRSHSTGLHDVMWHWKDDSGNWRPYSSTDCRILETAFQARDVEVSLNGLGCTYTVDFQNMIQINEETGNSRPVQRKTLASMAGFGGRSSSVTSVQSPSSGHNQQTGPDARSSLLESEPEIMEQFITMLFPILYEVYINAAGPSIRHECLSAIRRMVYHAPAQLLEKLMKDLTVSSHIANMLDCQDLKLVVGAIQLVHILLQKLPDTFVRLFRREGVLHQLDKLASMPVTPVTTAAAAVTTSSVVHSREARMSRSAAASASVKSLHSVGRPITWGSDEAMDRYYRALADHHGRHGTDKPPLPHPPPIDFQYLASPPSLSKAGSIGALTTESSQPPTTTSAGANTGTTASYYVGDMNEGLNALSAAPPSTDPRTESSEGNQASATNVTSGYGLFRWVTPQVPILPVFDTNVPPPLPIGTTTEGLNSFPSAMSISAPPPLYADATASQPGAAVGTPPVAQNLSSNVHMQQHSHSHSLKRERKREKDSFAVRKKRAEESTKSVAPGGHSKEKKEKSSDHGRKGRSHSSRSGGVSAPRHVPGAPSTTASHGHSKGSGANANGSVPTSTSSASKNFLSSLPLPKWARSHTSSSAGTTPTQAAGRGSDTSSLRMPPSFAVGHLTGGPERLDRFLSVPSNYFYAQSMSTAQNDANKQKIRAWIKAQAEEIKKTYFSTKDGKHEDVTDTLSVLKKVATNLNSAKDALLALEELRGALDEDSVSPFEILHSGLVEALLTYLTEGKDVARTNRLKLFCATFLNIIETDRGPSFNMEANRVPLSNLVAKLNACLTQIEQFPVKVHDVPSAGSGQLRGVYALKFFHTHQLKCYLRRHPQATSVRQWRRGPVKIDPLASIGAVERYLLLRGYGRSVHEGEESDLTDSEDSENPDDEDASVRLAANPNGQNTEQATPNGGSQAHQLQFLINDNVLPYNMTLYQAIRQYGIHGKSSAGGGEESAETDSEMNMMGYAAIWVNTHTLHYRLAPSSEEGSASKEDQKGKTTPGSKKSSKAGRSKVDPLWSEGKVPDWTSPLNRFLLPALPVDLSVKEMSHKCLALMRVLNAVNRYWWCLYDHAHLDSYKPALSAPEFVNVKIAAKANRQLRDPLMILTGNIPNWLRQLALVCPFLLPFDTRHMLLYVIAFDRDRALQRLLDTSPDLVPTTEADRIAPRLEKKKLTISRDDFLKQAESVISEVSGSKHVLEVQYRDEVGTGLGPTLEFYAILSKEFQKYELMMWRGEKHVAQSEGEFVHTSHGLYPLPLPHHVKPGHLSRLRSRFKMLGRVMARTLMDSRMIDLSLNPAFYRWLLGEESHLSYPDLAELDPVFYRSMGHMFEYVRRKQFRESSTPGTKSSKTPDTDSATVEDLSLDFTLPGQPAFELMKNGKATEVTIENIEQFLQLTLHWSLTEGVARQMEAFKDGFESLIPLDHLKMFYPEEMDQLFCGQDMVSAGQWDATVLLQCIRPDHGYSLDSDQIRWLVELLSKFDGPTQRKFLQFTTGCPKLPIGGVRSLNPPLTVVRRSTAPEDPDQYLPSVMTCVNYLKLPAYSSLDIMRDRLLTAVEEGQKSFHLS